MRPTFLGFETCKRGIMTNQKVLDIVGQNLTNWDTPGYTRQRVDTVSVASSPYNHRYAGLRSELAGQGQEMKGVSQVRDAYLDKRFRDEYGDASYYSQTSTILTDVRDALKEFNSTAGIGGCLTQIYNSCQTFMENPSDPAMANLLMVSFQNMTQVLHELSNKLDAAGEQQKFDLETSIDDFNMYAEKLSNINEAIRNEVAVSGSSDYFGPNELLDERNLILDEMAKYGDLDVETKKDGTVTVRMNGHVAVSGNMSDRLVYTGNNDGTVSVRWNSTGKDSVFTKGAIKAYTDIINGRGPNASISEETSERGLRYYRDRLDTFASTMARVYNEIVPTQVDDNGEPVAGASYKTLMGARIEVTEPDGTITHKTSNSVPVTAANISISDEWLKDASYVMHKKDDLNQKYANLLMMPIKNDKSISFRSHGETFTGTFEEYVNDYTIILNTDVNYHESRRDATADIANEMLDRRDEVSAVARDDETVTMMTYQKAYQAVSRVMTVLDEALDVLINRTGMVGR